MHSGEDDPECETTERKQKKKRRGTRGQAKCKPLYGRTPKVPNSDRQTADDSGVQDEQERQQQEAVDKSPYSQRLSELSTEEREELNRLTSAASTGQPAYLEVPTEAKAAPTKAVAAPAQARALRIRAKQHAKPTSARRPESPERPEISQWVAAAKLENSLFSQRQFRRVLNLFTA